MGACIMANASDDPSEDIAHLKEKIDVLQRRLNTYNVQLAKVMGNPSATVQITFEQKEVERELNLALVELRRLQPGPLVNVSPYLGLLTFQETNKDVFFGRDALIADLVEHLNRAPFLAVLGASGSGKSSVVRAGLIPQLKSGVLPGSETWCYITLKPGAQPLDTLAVEMVKLQQGDLSQSLIFSQQLSNSDRAFQLALDILLERTADQRLVLVVDQFEELWTSAPQEEEARALFKEQQQRPFIQRLLTSLTSQDKSLIVVLTMRLDFLDQAASYPELAQAISAHNVIVSPMSSADLREIIIRPLQKIGGSFEAGLVEELVKQGEQGPLPLLEYTLAELWEKRRPDGMMTWEAYRELGGVEGALAARADAILQEHYTPEQQNELRQVLLRLVQPGEGAADTRRRMPLEQLVPVNRTPEELDLLLKPLIDERLLTTGRDITNNEETVEISHEQLINAWPTFKRWINEARNDLRIQRRLEEATQEWEANARNTELLWSGLRLSQAKEWLERAQPRLNARDQAFIDASRKEEQARIEAEEAARQYELEQAQALAEEQRLRAEKEAAVSRQLRQQAIYLAAAFVVALIAAFSAVVFGVRAQQSAVAEQIQRATAVAASERAEQEAEKSLARQLAAQAERDAAIQQDRALLLSVQAYRLFDDLQTRGALLKVLRTNERLLGFIKGHTSSVNSVVISPDSKTLVSTGKDASVRLWDMASRKSLGEPLQGQGSAVRSVAFSPDARFLALLSDNTIQLWDMTNGQPLGQGIQGDSIFIDLMMFSPNGKILASASQDHSIQLWDVASQQPLGEPLRGHVNTIKSMRFSPDGAMLASAGGDFTIRLWDAVSGQPLGEPLQGHTGLIRDLAFSPDGKTLASASWDKTVRLWDVANKRPLGERLRGHKEPVATVAFSPDGELLASAGDDATILLWNVANRQLVGTLYGHTDAINRVVFSSDGKVLASASSDATIRLWDVVTRKSLGEPLRGHTGSITSIAFSLDGTVLASSGNDQSIRLWDMVRRQPLRQQFQDNSVSSSRSVTFSSDARMLAIANNDDNIIQLWEVANGQLIGNGLRGHTTFVNSMAFSPDAKILASADWDGIIRLWDVDRQQPRGEGMKGHSSVINSVAFSPDGKILASASNDMTIRLWNVATGQPIGEALKGHSGAINRVAFSPDGKILASASHDMTIRLWEVASGQPIGEALQGHLDYVYSVAFSPDGTLLASASGDKTIRLWDVATGQPFGEMLQGHTNTVNIVAFSPDGQILASTSYDGTIRLWDVEDQQPIGEPLQGYTFFTGNIAFTPDGKTLASAGFNGNVQLWDVNFQSWIERACRIAGRNLSQDEWRRFIGSERPYERTCPMFPPGEGAPEDAS
jgi:WD40 repeat protein